MNLFGLTLSDVQKFFLIFIRLATIMAIIPFYGERSVPIQLKLGLALLISVIVYPLLTGAAVPQETQSLLGFSVSMLQSLLAGLMVGFIPLMLFAGVQLGGELIGFQMGFGITSVLDPRSEEHTSELQSH